MEINYYAYTDRTVAMKQRLADIFSGLARDFGQLIVNLDSFQKSGNFERLARILLPETAVRIARVDTVAKTAFWVRHPEVGLNNYADFERYLAQPDVHIVDDTSAVRSYSATAFQHDILNIDTVSDLLILPTEPTAAEQLVAPKTDNQVLKEVLPADLLAQLKIETYCVSVSAAFEVVAQFEQRLGQQFKGVSMPDNEMIRTRLYQTFITGYRLTLLKTSPNGRPVVYSHNTEILAVLKFLMNPDVVVEKEGSFERVDGPQLFNQVMAEADLIHDQSQTSLPVMDDITGSKRVTVTVNNYVSPENHQVRSQHLFDVLTA